MSACGHLEGIFLNTTFIRAGTLAALSIALCGSALAADFFNGFETDISGWDAFGGSFNATRVSSGTNGITAATGGFYGQTGTAATNWGGYNQSFASTGYVTSVDIFLDMSGGWANDTRFAYTSAINNSGGTHLRDFVFSGGFYNDLGLGNRFVFSASNNAPGWPQDPGRDPFTVSTTGWYTMEHSFGIVGGVLSVDMRLRGAGGALLHSWTLSNPADVAANVGGNRYGWFTHNQFGTLAIDNSRRYSPGAVPEPFTMGLGLASAGLFLRRRLKSARA
jgi:hypothetical protein